MGVEVGEAEEEVGSAAGVVVVFEVEGGVGVGGVGGPGVGADLGARVVVVEHGAEGGDGFGEVGGGEGAGAEGGDAFGLGEEGFAFGACEEEREIVECGVEAGRDCLEGLGGVQEQCEQVRAGEGRGGRGFGMGGEGDHAVRIMYGTKGVVSKRMYGFCLVVV